MTDVLVENISKTYPKLKHKALDNINLEIEKGALFGLIGPDGAGKTTLFRILTTLLLPDEGRATVNNFDVVNEYKAIRKRVGYMPGKFSLYQDMSVSENLHFFATIFNTSIQQNYNLIKSIYEQLEPFKDRLAGQLSGGMKQKLALCCALIHRPTVLFLDEPTTGVDTVSRKEFWEMLKHLKTEGITILVSTPYMDEANLCEKIALIQDGKIMSVNTPQQIIKDYKHQLYAIKANDMSRLLNLLRANKQIQTVYSFGEFHHISFKEHNNNNIQVLTNTLQQNQLENIIINPISPTIEDCFIQQMSNSSNGN
ncbi:MAG: ABC transporter ATP-binding protein [Chitinophagales bacterium]|nr:ABC transporter ATP-binding protein [Chitinophagales bacterium]